MLGSNLTLIMQTTYFRLLAIKNGTSSSTVGGLYPIDCFKVRTASRVPANGICAPLAGTAAFSTKSAPKAILGVHIGDATHPALATVRAFSTSRAVNIRKRGSSHLPVYMFSRPQNKGRSQTMSSSSKFISFKRTVLDNPYLAGVKVGLLGTGVLTVYFGITADDNDDVISKCFMMMWTGGCASLLWPLVLFVGVLKIGNNVYYKRPPLSW